MPRVEALAADFAVRQMLLREKNLPAQAASTDQGRDGVKTTRCPGKKPGAKGGGAGAYRAYMHVHHRGEKMSSESIRRHTAAFNALSLEELRRYQELGQQGLAAWRHGFSSFGEKARASTCGVAAAIPVAGAADSGSFSALAPMNARHFQDDFRPIRRAFAQQSAAERRTRRQQTEEDARLSAERVRDLPVLFQGVENEDTGCQSASKRSRPEVHTASWFPASLEFARAHWRHSAFMFLTGCTSCERVALPSSMQSHVA